MVYVTKFRANDLNPSKGKQIEFNNGAAQKFFGFSAATYTVSVECFSIADADFKKRITASFRLSPARGDYKIYQNDDESPDLKDVFLRDLQLNTAHNIDDYYAIRKKGEGQYQLFYVPKTCLFSEFFPKIAGDQIIFVDNQDDSAKNNVMVKGSWQTITYGAPGTGKSFKIKGETAKKKVFRTTFHPDSDYATFVGAYKPVMKKDGVAFTEVSRKDTGSGQFSLVEKHDQRYGIGYQFVEQVFTQAYIRAWAYQKSTGATETPKPVYLIIEEINRGNCAQVFGDLFQLLDRKPNGFSDYAIKPESDFGEYIAEKLGAVTGTFDATRRAVINNLYPEAEDGVDVVDEVLAGRLMLLPNNLYIRATMNTSDQSLFPMDSAFKRRWDWDYVAIQNHPNEDWKLEIDTTTHYRWWEFLDAINQEIFKATSAEDKQLGYYFVRTANKKIDLDMFVNKVVFYLWNSVFKDCYTDCEFMKQDKDKYFTFTSFFKDGVIDVAQAKAFLGKFKGLKSVEDQESAKKAAFANTAATTTEQPTADNA